ncbi:MAG TPA: amino acid ABC transporter permease [Frankiaceae bacterium]|jgi:glutamate transport system permease protein|nr:amino acid ABC transporter permease [Frankiaceae bacterium]
MTASVLYDELGPRGRRKVRVATAVSFVLLLLLVWVVLNRLADKGQLEGRRWENLLRGDLQSFLLKGLWANVKAAAVAMALALTLGTVLALARLSRLRVLRWASGLFIETFRALPQLLLILGAALVLPRYGFELPAIVYVVVGLTVYQGAVLAEIFRAGILSLDRGQSEAAYAVGLTYRQMMFLVVVPQAVRRMLPAIVSQLVTLFKDTSLGFVIAYEEMLRRGRFASQEFPESLLQILLYVALVFIVINISLSRFAQWLERRQASRYGGGAGAAKVTGVEDLAVLDAKPA